MKEPGIGATSTQGISSRVRAAGRAFGQRDVQVVVGLTVLAAVVRFATLGLQSFDHEEAVTAGGVLQPSLSATLSQTLLTERSGPPYYVLAWGWTRAFGTDPLGVRSLSALAGTLTVPAAFGFASTLVNRKTALLTAALVAFNPDLIWYSQEGRSYALFVFLFPLRRDSVSSRPAGTTGARSWARRRRQWKSGLLPLRP